MDEQTRYARQLQFSYIGSHGQEKLANSSVTIVGLGAAGTVLASHMVRSGVGYVRIIDRGIVEPYHLQHQMLYDETDASRHLPKVIAARSKLGQMNSDVAIEPVLADVHAANAEDLLKDSDIILDGTDNTAVRFLINDVSVKYRIPWIYGDAKGAEGTFAVIQPGNTPCFRCLSNRADMRKEDKPTGIISPLSDIVASFQALEAIKLLIGNSAFVNPHLERFIVWENQHVREHLKKEDLSPCPACKDRSFDFLDAVQQEPYAATVCGANTVQIRPQKGESVDLKAVSQRLETEGAQSTHQNEHLLYVRLPDYHLVIFPDKRMLVKGTEDEETARSLYERYLGAV